jgi:hypothetical protein
MARIKRDSSSWKARGIVRRDFRHDLGVSDETPPTGRRRKKPKQAITRHSHEWGEWHTSTPRLEMNRYTSPGYAHYSPWLRTRTCRICHQRESELIEHEVSILHAHHEGLQVRACTCGEQWTWRKGMSPRCPADYAGDGYTGSRTVRLRHHRLPAIARWMGEPIRLMSWPAPPSWVREWPPRA